MSGANLSPYRSDDRLWDGEGYFLQSLADAADVGMVVVAVDGTVLMWNGWMEEASGIPRADAIGSPLLTVFGDAPSPRLLLAVDQALHSHLSSRLSPQINRRQFPLKRTGGSGAQGEPMIQSVVTKPLANEMGDKLCLIQVFDVSQASDRDRLLRSMRGELEHRVTERTRELTSEIARRLSVEADLRNATAQANAANTAKTNFLATVSHELRTPLNSIIGFSELMVFETLGKIRPKAYEEYIRLTLTSATHLLQLVNDILDVSAIEAGGLELDEGSVDLNVLCRDTLERVRVLAEDRAHELAPIAGPKLPMIRGDRTRLEQIVLNLLTNAIKFTPAGGRIALVRSREDNGDIVISITDSGPGMTATEIETAFEPFQQIDRGTAGKHEGVGLGLSLSRTLTEAHGGRLTLESVEGECTTAVLRLPGARVIDAR